MSSQLMAVDVLVKACQDGDPYSGLQTFKATLQRKVRHRDEAATQAMLLEAFQQAIVPFRCSEAASELSREFFSILKEFGHNSDSFGFGRVRAILSCFTSVPESEASVAWCRAHVQFLVSALEWLRTCKGLLSDADKQSSLEYAMFLNGALSHAYMRLAHCTESDEEVSCEALANAYRTSLCCTSNMELILSVVEELRSRLTQMERDFLVARTLYGLLSAAGGNTGSSPRSALAAANALLPPKAVPVEHAALDSFLRDVLLVFNAVAKTPSRPSVKQLGGKVLEALCSAYCSTLVPVSDLDWVALLHAFPTESE
ncbi:hypothetical protein TraAM80_04616 [Trypanosoma rangeli]|uniref:Uncharacterized protein n=1 Tax=Trypanosoma rangeli TaxID=5698 RepID=A0A3R7KCM0_TRYRA|nr:uncharacterized protein TraAM80_04616 [Trypanosoma rangeli]RNF05406.1 hypothetical protein TraAM80_04616 [Trypanosoma rangeli]|eukprot:RNF05406.1 hypothetical protein TraAM80_04616 [Trypanosoma rangeli]